MKKQILIVDDLTLDIILSSSVIKTCILDFEIDIACDGTEALMQLRSKQYDLILLDIKMPKVDGFELLQLLHTQKLDSLPPIFMLSCSNFPEDEKLASALGVVEYVHKSMEYSEFKANLRGALERHGFC